MEIYAVAKIEFVIALPGNRNANAVAWNDMMNFFVIAWMKKKKQLKIKKERGFQAILVRVHQARSTDIGDLKKKV